MFKTHQTIQSKSLYRTRQSSQKITFIVYTSTCFSFEFEKVYFIKNASIRLFLFYHVSHVSSHNLTLIVMVSKISWSSLLVFVYNGIHVMLVVSENKNLIKKFSIRYPQQIINLLFALFFYNMSLWHNFKLNTYFNFT